MQIVKKGTALLLAVLLLCALTLSGCGAAKIEAGDYTGSVRFNHPMELESAGMDGTATVETVEDWGMDVVITVDEDGIIWNITPTEPEGYKGFANFMTWTVYGGKFISSITGVYSCADIMKITVDTEEDGFPVLTGDCGGIHLADKEMTLLNNQEVACALIILAMQNAITENNLA